MMGDRRITIALDGPAGSGKSTVAKLIAQKYGINYMDTGAMYRAAALAMTERGISVADREAVKAELASVSITVEYKEDGQHVFADGRDVNGLIRTPEISKKASDVSAIPEVRLKLVEAQREAAKSFDIIMDGRDIGSFVLPDAPLKIYLTASAEVRAARRKKELDEKGIFRELREIESEMRLRDKQDSEREFAPLKVAEGAVVIDTSEMSIEQVISAVDTEIKRVFK